LNGRALWLIVDGDVRAAASLEEIS
jgi:hypothetical protein